MTYQKTKFSLLGIPFDKSVSRRRGAAQEPAGIRKGFWKKLYDGKVYDLGTRKVFSAKKKELIDVGNVKILSSRRKWFKSAEKKVSNLCQDSIPIILGGDHMVTYPSFSGFAENLRTKRKTDPVLVLFDAHIDVFESHKGNKYYHGSFIKRLVENGLLKPSNIIVLGTRSPIFRYKGFGDFVAENKIIYYTADEIEAKGIIPILQVAMKKIKSGYRDIYCSVDIDCLDPAFAPATGTPEPAGLTSMQLFQAVKWLARRKVGALDLVEVAPRYDTNELTQILAADLIWNFMSIYGEK
jgi:agmatinase